MSKLPEILDRKTVAESRLFRIEQLDLRFSNGECREYERIVGRATGSVMIVPLLDAETVLLIREYSAGMEAYTLGFPKGAVDEGEALEITANRELQEEVGYSAKHFERLGELSASPGYLSAVMEVCIATTLTPSRIPGDEPEPIEVVPWSLNDIDGLLADPGFYEARSVAALLWTKRVLDARS